jgi:hypothetical protein
MRRNNAMKTKSAYEEALHRPIKDGVGWKYADAESMQAAYAKSLALKHCLRPEAVFNWAQRHNVDLHKNMVLLYEFNDVLLVAILNDWELQETLEKLKII